MGTRRTPRGRGRPRLLLDPGVEKRLVDATTAGAPMALAAAHAGVSERAFVGWMERGFNELAAREDGEPADPGEDVFVVFYEKIRLARSAAGMRSLASIQKAAVGGTVVEETTETMPDGTVRKTVKRQPPDWRAGAWYLERQLRVDFGKQSELAVTGPGGGPIQVEHTVDIDALSARLHANVQAALEAAPGGRDEIEGEIVEQS